ncbi:hypothetical protein Efla_002444 [Eimeria flavescens]
MQEAARKTLREQLVISPSTCCAGPPPIEETSAGSQLSVAAAAAAAATAAIVASAGSPRQYCFFGVNADAGAPSGRCIQIAAAAPAVAVSPAAAAAAGIEAAACFYGSCRLPGWWSSVAPAATAIAAAAAAARGGPSRLSPLASRGPQRAIVQLQQQEQPLQQQEQQQQQRPLQLQLLSCSAAAVNRQLWQAHDCSSSSSGGTAAAAAAAAAAATANTAATGAAAAAAGSLEERRQPTLRREAEMRGGLLLRRQNLLLLLPLLLQLANIRLLPSAAAAAGVPAAATAAAVREVVTLEAELGHEPAEASSDLLLRDEASAAAEVEEEEEEDEGGEEYDEDFSSSSSSETWLAEIEEALAGGATHRLYFLEEGEAYYQIAGTEDVSALLEQLKPQLRKQWKQQQQQQKKKQQRWSEAMWGRVVEGVLLRAGLHKRDAYPQSWFVARAPDEAPKPGALLTPLRDYELTEEAAKETERQLVSALVVSLLEKERHPGLEVSSPKGAAAQVSSSSSNNNSSTTSSSNSSSSSTTQPPKQTPAAQGPAGPRSSAAAAAAVGTAAAAAAPDTAATPADGPATMPLAGSTRLSAAALSAASFAAPAAAAAATAAAAPSATPAAAGDARSQASSSSSKSGSSSTSSTTDSTSRNSQDRSKGSSSQSSSRDSKHPAELLFEPEDVFDFAAAYAAGKLSLVQEARSRISKASSSSPAAAAPVANEEERELAAARAAAEEGQGVGRLVRSFGDAYYFLRLLLQLPQQQQQQEQQQQEEQQQYSSLLADPVEPAPPHAAVVQRQLQRLSERQQLQQRSAAVGVVAFLSAFGVLDPAGSLQLPSGWPRDVTLAAKAVALGRGSKPPSPLCLLVDGFLSAVGYPPFALGSEGWALQQSALSVTVFLSANKQMAPPPKVTLPFSLPLVETREFARQQRRSSFGRSDSQGIRYLLASHGGEPLGLLAAASYLHTGRLATSLQAGPAQRRFWAQQVPPQPSSAAAGAAAAASAGAAAAGGSYTMDADGAKALEGLEAAYYPTEEEETATHVMGLQRFGSEQRGDCSAALRHLLPAAAAALEQQQQLQQQPLGHLSRVAGSFFLRVPGEEGTFAAPPSAAKDEASPQGSQGSDPLHNYIEQLLEPDPIAYGSAPQGPGPHQDSREYALLVEAVANDGDPDGLAALAELYLHGSPEAGIVRDRQRAFELWREAADRGDANAALAAAHLLLEGRVNIAGGQQQQLAAAAAGGARNGGPAAAGAAGAAGARGAAAAGLAAGGAAAGGGLGGVGEGMEAAAAAAAVGGSAASAAGAAAAAGDAAAGGAGLLAGWWGGLLAALGLEEAAADEKEAAPRNPVEPFLRQVMAEGSGSAPHIATYLAWKLGLLENANTTLAGEALRAAADLGDSNAQILYATAHLAALGPSTAAAAAAAAAADPLSAPSTAAAGGAWKGSNLPLLPAGNATEALFYFSRAAVGGRHEAAYSAALLLLQGASPFHKTLQARCEASFKVLQKVAFLHRRVNLVHALSLHAHRGGDVTGALLLQLLLSEIGYLGGHVNAAALWRQAAAQHKKRLHAVEELMEELLAYDFALAGAAPPAAATAGAVAEGATRDLSAAAEAEAAAADSNSNNKSNSSNQDVDAVAVTAAVAGAPAQQPQQQQQQQHPEQQQQPSAEEVEKGVRRVLLERYSDPSADMATAAAAAGAAAPAAAAAAAVEARVAAAGGTCGVESRVSPFSRAAPQRLLAAGDFRDLHLNLPQKCLAAAGQSAAAAAAAAARSVLQQLQVSEYVHCWLTAPKPLELLEEPPAAACTFAALRRAAMQGDVASMVSLSELYAKAAKEAAAAVRASAAAADDDDDRREPAQQERVQQRQAVSPHAGETAEAISRYWALKAAATGDGRGVFMLARLKEEGIGGPQQREEATKEYWSLAADPLRPAGGRLLGVWGLLRVWWQWEWDLLQRVLQGAAAAAARPLLWLVSLVLRKQTEATLEAEALQQVGRWRGLLAAARRLFGGLAAAAPPAAAARPAEEETLDRHPLLLILSLYFSQEEDRRFWAQFVLALVMLLTAALLAIQLAMRVPELRAAAAAAAAPAAADAAAAPRAGGVATAARRRHQQPGSAAAVPDASSAAAADDDDPKVPSEVKPAGSAAAACDAAAETAAGDAAAEAAAAAAAPTAPAAAPLAATPNSDGAQPAAAAVAAEAAAATAVANAAAAPAAALAAAAAAGSRLEDAASAPTFAAAAANAEAAANAAAEALAASSQAGEHRPISKDTGEQQGAAAADS